MNLKIFFAISLILSIHQLTLSAQEIKLPYDETFDTESSIQNFTIIDNNQDNSTWQWGEGAVYYFTSLDNLPADDWLITRGIKLSKHKKYIFSLDTKCDGEDTPEKIAIALGKAPTAESMSSQIVVTTTIKSEAFIHLNQTFEPKEDGIYYIGIHCISAPDMMSLTIDNLSIKERPTTSLPKKIENLCIMPNPQGALSAKISFNLPTLLEDNSPIEIIDSVEIYRNDTKIKVIKHLKPGIKVNYNDLEAQQGYNKYGVIAIVNGKRSIENAISVFVGEDVPEGLKRISLTIKDNYPTLSWQTPEIGYNGYQIDPTKITYEIYGCTSITNRKLIAKDIKGNSYQDLSTFINEGEQHHWFYAVYAVNSQGKSPIAYSEEIVVGRPYPLPFKESVKNRKIENKMWGLTPGSKQSIIKASNESQDNDGGSLILRSTMPNDTLTLTSGKIMVKNAINLTASFYVKLQGYESLTFHIVKDGIILQSAPIKANTEEGKWEKIMIDLSQFSILDYIQIYFGAQFGSTPQDIYIDNIRVERKEEMMKTDVTKNDNIQIMSSNNTLKIINPNRRKYFVYNTEGKIVFTSDERVISLTLPRSTYIIKMPEKAIKVAIN